MSDRSRRIERAIRITPRAVRARYEAEWRHDLAGAEANGLAPREVERAAWRLAVDLRARRLGGLLLGAHGRPAAVGAWVALVGGLVVLGLLPFGLVLVVLVLLALATVLARVGIPSHGTHWLLVTSIVVGAASATFVIWAARAKLAAADAGVPEPAATAWGGAAVVVFLCSGAALVASAVGAVTRERRVQR